MAICSRWNPSHRGTSHDAAIETTVHSDSSSEDPAEVDGAIAEALAYDGPALIDAVVNRMELAMPPSINAQMAEGFSLFMVKAIMSGRGEEVIDLARSNLWR
jgi:pyruvate dehydrogenase (quinone)